MIYRKCPITRGRKTRMLKNQYERLCNDFKNPEAQKKNKTRTREKIPEEQQALPPEQQVNQYAILPKTSPIYYCDPDDCACPPLELELFDDKSIYETVARINLERAREPNLKIFWQGYIAGLLDLAPELVNKPIGYDMGRSFVDPTTIRPMSTRQLSRVTGRKESAIRQHAHRVPGAYKNSDRKWRFFQNAIEFFEQLPGRGRPRGKKKKGEIDE